MDMYTYVRMNVEPIYRLAFMKWMLEDGMEMPLYLQHLGSVLLSVGVDLDTLNVDILEEWTQEGQ